jgi:protein-tyrosine phosphatase
MIGRIDVHSHLLPGIDDGCPTVEESIRCARMLVEAGYTHSVCTPHIWPNLPRNTSAHIAQWTLRLQQELEEADIPLRLIPGGEHNLSPTFTQLDPQALVTYGMQRRFLLIDFWNDRLPAYFPDAMRWIQSQGLTVILAHPERMRAIQDQPALADQLAEMGVLLQGNLQCLGDPPQSDTYRVAEQYLREGRYFMLGSDLHNLASLPVRLAGLRRAVELVGDETVWKLTRDNPRTLVPTFVQG